MSQNIRESRPTTTRIDRVGAGLTPAPPTALREPEHDRRRPPHVPAAAAVRERPGRGSPSALDIADLDAPLIAAFLEHLERERGNTARTRNNRLAAIHSLFTYLALQHPEHAATIQRVLAIPPKRTGKHLLT